jgi:hypothetical protein
MIRGSRQAFGPEMPRVASCLERRRISGKPAKIQFFKQESGVWAEIPAIVQEFQAILPEMSIAEEKGCIIAGIYSYQLDLGVKTCRNAGICFNARDDELRAELFAPVCTFHRGEGGKKAREFQACVAAARRPPDVSLPRQPCPSPSAVRRLQPSAFFQFA